MKVQHKKSADLQAEKAGLIEEILANPVYMPESGVMQNLQRALLLLSRSDLENLKTVVSLKD